MEKDVLYPKKGTEELESLERECLELKEEELCRKKAGRKVVQLFFPLDLFLISCKDQHKACEASGRAALRIIML